MQKILIPLAEDLSKDKVLQQIELIAKPSDTKVILFRSVSMPDSVGYLKGDDNDDAKEIIMARQTHLKELGEFEEDLKEAGYLSESFVMVGQLEEDLSDLVQQINPDMILMLTEGAENIFEDIFGTNTSSVIDKIKVPVFVFQYTRTQTALKKAVVGLPLDSNQLGAVKKYFEWADAHHVESDFVKIDKKFELIDDEYFNKLRDLYPNREINITQREYQDIDEGIEKYANETKADLIVLFATDKMLIEKIFNPSVTQSLIKHCKVPLLIYHC